MLRLSSLTTAALRPTRLLGARMFPAISPQPTTSNTATVAAAAIMSHRYLSSSVASVSDSVIVETSIGSSSSSSLSNGAQSTAQQQQQQQQGDFQSPATVGSSRYGRHDLVGSSVAARLVGRTGIGTVPDCGGGCQ
mmetsp:Transcript_5053/g.12604  ORF Transcript_5053/g.12604 Transcript_5053/m.12604 type:complete len:136 (-) Transcript_5053:246-653(-)